MREDPQTSLASKNVLEHADSDALRQLQNVSEKFVAESMPQQPQPDDTCGTKRRKIASPQQGKAKLPISPLTPTAKRTPQKKRKSQNELETPDAKTVAPSKKLATKEKAEPKGKHVLKPKDRVSIFLKVVSIVDRKTCKGKTFVSLCSLHTRRCRRRK